MKLRHVTAASNPSSSDGTLDHLSLGDEISNISGKNRVRSAPQTHSCVRKTLLSMCTLLSGPKSWPIVKLFQYLRGGHFKPFQADLFLAVDSASAAHFTESRFETNHGPSSELRW